MGYPRLVGAAAIPEIRPQYFGVTHSNAGRTEKIKYWFTSADNDWVVANHLLEKRDYPYALFFAHLTLEKILKAIFIRITNEAPPLTHRLGFLAEKAGLPASSEQLEHSKLQLILIWRPDIRMNGFLFSKSVPPNLPKTSCLKSRNFENGCFSRSSYRNYKKIYQGTGES